jgi:hypothetical protein
MAVCYGCGGAGGQLVSWVDRNGVKRSMWVVCDSCGGSGQQR